MTLEAKEPSLDTIQTADSHERYLTLDALRSVAALAVVVVHIPILFGLPHQNRAASRLIFLF